jgi:hypothetical protein
MRTLITSIAFVAALVMCGGSALAADQPVTGKKLLIKNNADPTKNKTVILIKDTSVVSPASQPTTGRSALSEDSRTSGRLSPRRLGRHRSR